MSTIRTPQHTPHLPQPPPQGTPNRAAAASASSSSPHLPVASSSPFSSSGVTGSSSSGASPSSTPLLGHGQTSRAINQRRRTGENASNRSGGENNREHNATSSSSSSSSNITLLSSPPPLLPLPDSQLSSHARLSAHLDDYIVLVEQLFESFDPSLAASIHRNNSSSSSSSVSPAASHSLASAAHSNDTFSILSSLLRKDSLLHLSLGELLRHQESHRALRRKYEELQGLDEEIRKFCTSLGALEQQLLACDQENDAFEQYCSTQVYLPRATPVSRGVSVRSILTLGEKLARMSFAPSDHLEKRDDALGGVCQPPAPLQTSMAHSLLQLSPEEMEKIIEAQEKEKKEAEEEAKRNEAQGTATAAAAGDSVHTTTMMDLSDTSHLPGSVQALGRQESAVSTSGSALPSFAELNQTTSTAAANNNNGLAATQMWRQESAQRSMATAAPVALDLDLESSDSDESEED